MKANQKFLRGDDAVSPVIAVILMVAITVVLAATVYVWVSGFGSQSSAPAKSLSLTSNGAYDDDTTDTKEYVVASATSGMKYSDMTMQVGGDPFELGTGPAAETWYVEREGATITADDATVTAGDVIIFSDTTSFQGDTLRILDAQANSIILTLTIT